MAFYIFTFSAYRNYAFRVAIQEQSVWELPESWLLGFRIASTICYVVGGVLVAASGWTLGIVGTYNGDYFGILMEERLTQFPFNCLNNPMYTGSTLLFLAQALWVASPAGFVLTAWVYVVYWTCSSLLEEPFTAYIYSQTALEIESERLLRETKLSIETYRPITTVNDVVQWLESIGYGQYGEAFAANHIDGECLKRLDMVMLRDELHISSLGHRFKILDAISQKVKLEEKIRLNQRKINEWLSERKAIETKVAKVVDEVVIEGIKKRVSKAKLGVQTVVGNLEKNFSKTQLKQQGSPQVGRKKKSN